MSKRSAFKMGWLLVMFDLPVVTKKQRKDASAFRNILLDDGYMMIQFSVYARACVSRERMEKHLARVERAAPIGGNIRVMFITDHQWAAGVTIVGLGIPSRAPESMTEQLEFW